MLSKTNTPNYCIKFINLQIIRISGTAFVRIKETLVIAQFIEIIYLKLTNPIAQTKNNKWLKNWPTPHSNTCSINVNAKHFQLRRHDPRI